MLVLTCGLRTSARLGVAIGAARAGDRRAAGLRSTVATVVRASADNCTTRGAVSVPCLSRCRACGSFALTCSWLTAASTIFNSAMRALRRFSLRDVAAWARCNIPSHDNTMQSAKRGIPQRHTHTHAHTSKSADTSRMWPTNTASCSFMRLAIACTLASPSDADRPATSDCSCSCRHRCARPVRSFSTWRTCSCNSSSLALPSSMRARSASASSASCCNQTISEDTQLHCTCKQCYAALYPSPLLLPSSTVLSQRAQLAKQQAEAHVAVTSTVSQRIMIICCAVTVIVIPCANTCTSTSASTSMVGIALATWAAAHTCL